MAAPVLVSTVKLHDASTSQTASISGTIPAGTPVGALAVLEAMQNTGVNTDTVAPDGWTLLSGQPNGGPDRINNNLTAYLWAKNLTASDVGAAVNVTASGGSRMQGVLKIWAGAGDVADLKVNLATVTAAGSSPQTVTSPTVLTTESDCAIDTYWTVRGSSATAPTVTAPGTHTLDAQVKTAFTSSPNDTIATSHRTTAAATPDTYGGASATVNQPVTAIIYTVAIPPAAVQTAPSTAFEFAPTGAHTNSDPVPADPAVYDAVSGLVTWDTAVVFEDLTASAKCVNSSGVVATLEQDIGSQVSTRYLSRVLQVEEFTSGTFTGLVRWRNASTSLGEVRVNSSGTLILRDNVAGTSLGTVGPITFGQPFRIEVDIVDGQASMRFYADPTADTPSAVVASAAATWGPFDRILDGVSTPSGQTTVRVLYAADGDTANPSLSRWNAPTSGLLPGMRLYAVRGGVLKQLTLTRA